MVGTMHPGSLALVTEDVALGKPLPVTEPQPPSRMYNERTGPGEPGEEALVSPLGRGETEAQQLPGHYPSRNGQGEAVFICFHRPLHTLQQRTARTWCPIMAGKRRESSDGLGLSGRASWRRRS